LSDESGLIKRNKIEPKTGSLEQNYDAPYFGKPIVDGENGGNIE
jgi:hypothetical protein